MEEKMRDKLSGKFRRGVSLFLMSHADQFSLGSLPSCSPFHYSFQPLNAYVLTGHRK